MENLSLIPSYWKRIFFSVLLIFGFQQVKAQEFSDEKIENYLDQFSYYEYLDWDTAKMYLDSALTASKGISDPMLMGRLDLYQGWYFQDISQYDSSKAYFFKALDHYTQANSYNHIADVYGNLGNAFMDLGDIKGSLDYQMKSLQTNEQIILLSKDERAIDRAIRGRAYAWSNISNIYKILGQHRRSLNFEFKALNYELGGTDSIGMAISYINIGTSYDNLDKMDSAMYYTNLAHEIFKSEHYSIGLINSYLSLYRFKSLEGEYNKEYLDEALRLAREFEDTFSEVYVIGFLISEDFGFSRDSLQKLVDRGNYLIKEYDFESSLYRFYLDEAKLNAREGDYKLAYNALMKYIDYFSKRKERDENVDFENAELRHEFQLRSLSDSLEFQDQLNQQKLDNEKRIGRQRIITTVTIFGFGILAVLLLFIYRSLKVKKLNNQQLSEKNKMIESQKELVEEKNKEITDSINYAQRLQNAILPPMEMLNNDFEDAFVLYRPKDVVSGDFYWFEQRGNLVFVAAADCTGHGVPGAMVSVVCSNALNRSVNEFEITSPKEILNKTRELVIETFAKSGENVKDGMDISLCAFDKNSTKVLYAGANNPLWIIRENKYLTDAQFQLKSTVKGKESSLIELKATKQPIGLYDQMNDFEQTEIEVKPGDQFYLFSDGYADQFGGETGKKLKYRKFKQLLLKNHKKSAKEQEQALDHFMNDWIRDYEQVDDICVIGVRASVRTITP
ncbi:MAG: SpoIIE family protein phosphatase [Crocinitomicaceae bacterium]|nr:SpoIIE family protein phosphatase [Crocinitomicaceae bacterium]